eukprot:1139418-Pelagomonas_calceolata.AAC.3
MLNKLRVHARQKDLTVDTETPVIVTFNGRRRRHNPAQKVWKNWLGACARVLKKGKRGQRGKKWNFPADLTFFTYPQMCSSDVADTIAN